MDLRMSLRTLENIREKIGSFEPEFDTKVEYCIKYGWYARTTEHRIQEKLA